MESFKAVDFERNESIESSIDTIAKEFLALEERVTSKFEDVSPDKKEEALKILKSASSKILKLLKNTSYAAAAFASYVAVNPDSQIGYSDREQAISELSTDGIPSDQRFSAYKPGISELIYRGVSPWGYQAGAYSSDDDFFPEVFSALHEAGVPNTAMLQNSIPNIFKGREIEETHRSNETEDAWRLYLGLPQNHDTFGISDYSPEKSSDDMYYFKLNSFWDTVIANGKVTLSGYQNKQIPEVGHKFVTPGYGNSYYVGSNPMGNFTIGTGEDERGVYLYYYDIWDLASVFAENPMMKGVGRPYEIYDRLYFNPETLEVAD